MKSYEFNGLLNSKLNNETNRFLSQKGRELQDLLSPIACDEFVRTYFSRQSLLLRGKPNKFESIFSWEKLHRALLVGQKIHDKRYNIKASFTSGEQAGSPRPVIEAHHDQVSELLQAGATICITNIHMADPSLAQWAQAIRAQLNFSGTVGVNCYVSPDGSGLPMHYDKRVATSLQIAGKKHWRYSTESAKPWPPHNARYVQGDVEPAGVDPGKLPHNMAFGEVELNPGDLLCLPAGAWHAARAVGDCMALNLYFAPRNFMDQLLALIQNFALTSEQWRAGPPAFAGQIQGEIPKEISVYVHERLEEFCTLALAAMNEPNAFVEPWLNSLTQSPYSGWAPKPKPAPRAKNPEQQFCLALPKIHFIKNRDHLAVASEFGVVKLPTTLTAILIRLSVESRLFTLQDVLSWRERPNEPTVEELVSCIQRLIENGIIKMLD